MIQLTINDIMIGAIMGFNEKVHAFIAAKYYVYLTESFGERGEKAFIHATQYYAEQRGRRMAQLAIRNGEELTFPVYQKYGEWVNTEEVKALGCSNKNEVKSFSPDLEMHITSCPWHTQFSEMGLIEAGHIYCEHLDNSICRGFNPYISYLVPQTLHKNDYCIHIVKDVNYSENEKYTKRPEGLKGFDYHCAHSYWSYAEVSASIFEADGIKISSKVMEDFKNAYGEEMANIISSYKYTNFNVL